jgi:hypothetical protein
MFTPDSETRRLLVSERQAELARDVLLARVVRPHKVDSRRRRHVRRLRLHLRPAGDLS